MNVIKGTKADYSRSLFELRGTGIYRIDREEGEFVDVLKGVFPDYIARKIFDFHSGKKLEKSLSLGGLVGKTLPDRKAI